MSKQLAGVLSPNQIIDQIIDDFLFKKNLRQADTGGHALGAPKFIIVDPPKYSHSPDQSWSRWSFLAKKWKFSHEMRIIGLETSCDDTGAAIYDTEEGLLCHKLASQIEVHRPHGGVVPELAARDHIRTLTPLISAVMHDSRTTPEQIDGVAYTAGPGLIGALLVGTTVAQALAYGWGVPAIGVHHMEGHLLSPQLDAPVEYPFVALLVSGGHTLLANVRGPGRYEIMGDTLDDAVGEAFDKTAKLLGLSYPGGPAISRVAVDGREGVFRFPRPMTDRPGLAFSFSGLKTAVAQTLAPLMAQGELDAQTVADAALAFEQAACDTLTIKCKRALQETHYKRLIVAGGVSANQRLRRQLESLGDAVDASVHFPSMQFCTDNGAMIAYAGSLRLMHANATGQNTGLGLAARARWPLDSLEPCDSAAV